MLTSCVGRNANSYTEEQILEELDLVYKGYSSPNFPVVKYPDIAYVFFLDLEHGYCETAGSYIHLFADDQNWAIVFEKSGYQNRGGRAELELIYIGNCINYTEDLYSDRKAISNMSNIELITGEEYERIADSSQFEVIAEGVDVVCVRDTSVRIKQTPDRRMTYGDLVRYVYENNPELLRATDKEIKNNLNKDLPKLMTIKEFHHLSSVGRTANLSEDELYQMIARILVTKDTSYWKPTLTPNNHWRNWESGHL